ncbi:outer membrane protein assembly factor BamC [Shimwellia blattae]|uniref:Outer membrane protein assembly factor BamC n=1 Tax=Shimwellia blattae (strain ATCC 29907 / DSM 4481 / JCM 1650 / NBRC 105725 / CDC 9005-74) TaxID=630626 RepID=I2B6M9_SHIBC|nr:outer membrane protein assembly factor BamC [Shimwellia blattae]AFJ46183.1 lipoprotein-34 precursor [Shimwellia blattae DSM 4481 = NBRC 105725]GAB81177.1 outer membrane protein biogenesis protein BamC [Shimwellia blattae DSM 4481 = NBRC 105725]VDY63650.1 Lipoprotein 34 precursor [Shimwellia blattae]VEC21736.1 Lipoprotein 34 precursor [Shimwellia blattae]
MAYSVQKSTVATVVGLALTMMLTACSSDSRYKRQVSGDESYLEAAPLAELHAPAGMILPVTSGDYAIPVTNGSGLTGKQLDIRPPAQALALVTGARTQFTGDTATLMVENGRSGGLWPQVVNVVQGQNYTITKRDDAAQTLSTDWVQWNRADEDQQYRGRYQITVRPQGYQQAVVVKLVNLEQDGKPVADPSALQRYSAQMLNVISAGLDKTQTARQNALDNRNVNQISVQSGADDTGLPLLVARAPFSVVWSRLPATLQKVGMKVTDSTRSTGNMTVEYKPGSADWSELGVSEPDLASGEYKVQVGDLDNRSSIQFIDPKGHTLSQSRNDALVAVLQAAFNK